MAYLGCLLISLGLFFMLTGVLGVIRFDAFFSKVHASGTMDSLATPLLIFGMALLYGSVLSVLKCLLIVLFIWIGSATTTYTLCKTKFKENDNTADN